MVAQDLGSEIQSIAGGRLQRVGEMVYRWRIDPSLLKGLPEHLDALRGRRWVDDDSQVIAIATAGHGDVEARRVDGCVDEDE